MEYCINQRNAQITEHPGVVTYGITIIQDEQILCQVEDVSTDWNFTNCLLAKIKRPQISSLHLMDVVEDALS